MTKASKGRGYVYYLHYHIVWCVKYRNAVLVGDVERDTKAVLREIADEQKIEILSLKTDKDHVHMLISCTPQQTIPSILKSFKGTSARRLFLLHPSLKNALWGGHLWNPSYFVATVSDTTDEQIKHYIEHQQINWK